MATSALARAVEPAPDEVRRGLSLAELFRAHAQDVARWAGRLGGPLMDVEDVVQEVFLVAHRQLPRFRGDARVTTWLFRITANVVRHRRRKDRLRRWLTGNAERIAAATPTDTPAAPEQLQQAERARMFYRVLDQLPERSRLVLVMFELEGMSGEEIATVLNARVGTVWVWLHRARAAFLERMRALESQEEAP